MKLRGLRVTALIMTLLVATVSTCLAQFSSNVQGTITDASGAVVAGATVVLHGVGTGVDLKQTTNRSGSYRFSSIAPGPYEVRTRMPGFKATSESVTITTGETRGLDIALSVGTATTDVTVSSVASAINPDENRLQSTLTAEEIGRLPLPNRDVQMLMALTPGVVGVQNESATNGYGNSIFAGSFNPPYHANGAGSNSNLFLIDDLPVNDAQVQGNALILPNAEMIAQVSLQTQTYSVENGTAASLQTAFTTKSGTNGYHGTVDYSYAGSNVGAANQPVVNAKVPFHQNLLLASFGGPIIKERTFFFGSVEKQNSAIGAASLANPYFTPQFAQWALGAFPNSGAAKGLVFAPPTRDSGGKVKLASDYYPSTCGTTQNVPASPALTYNIPCSTPVYVVGATTNLSQPFNGTQWNVRLDQNLRGGNDRIYGMYERIDQSLGNLTERPKLDAVTPSQNKYFSLNYVHVFTPRLLNELHFGNLRVINGSKLGDPRAASIPYLPILLDTAAGFQFTFPFGLTPFGAQTNKQHTYALRDTVSYTKGNHNLRGGYQFFRGDVFQDSSQIYSRPFVPFYFTDTFSWVSNTAQAGYSLFTIGGNGKYTPQFYGASSSYNGGFVEDNWKVARNLTLTMGVRYDNFGNPKPYGSTAQPFVPLTPGAGSTFQQQAINTTTHVTQQAFPGSQNVNFAPRAGFAYTPFSSRTTLLRGGIGLYYNVLTPFQIAGNLPTQPPNRISLSPFGVVPYGDFQTSVAPYGYNYSYPTYGTDPSGNIYSDPAKTAVFSANINGFVPDIKPEKALNYSFGLEQELVAKMVFGVTYAGSHGYDLVYGASSGGQSAGDSGGSNADYNLAPNLPAKTRPTSEWGRINYGRNGLSSNYNAMVVTLRQSYKGLTYQANYNWARALQYAPSVYDSAQGTTYRVWKAIYDPKSYYGPSSSDVQNSFSFGGGYEVPKLFDNSIANQVTANWRVSTIIIAQSGTPFTVVKPGVDYQNDGSQALDGAGNGTPGFPNYTGTKRSFSHSDIRAAVKAGKGLFTPGQFTDPAGVGTAPVTSSQGANSFRNPGYFSVNAGIAKGFSIHLPGRSEEVKLFLRGEAVNLFNRTNYQNFHTDVADGNFGSITAANQARYIQIGGRLEF